IQRGAGRIARSSPCCPSARSPPGRTSRHFGIPFTQPFALPAVGGAVPLDRAGRPRPAAGRGGRGLRAGEGARPTLPRWRHLAESWGYPPPSYRISRSLPIRPTRSLKAFAPTEALPCRSHRLGAGGLPVRAHAPEAGGHPASRLQGFPPYITTDESGNPAGLAVQVVREAAKRAGIRVQWVEVRDAENALRESLIDLYPILTVSPERKQSLYGSVPWWESSQSLLSLRERPLKT